MAFDILVLRNPQTHQIKRAPVGFSWTTFFFGLFPALFRGDFKWLFIQFGASLVTFGLSAWVFAFMYNKFYFQGLLKQGYLVVSSEKNAPESMIAGALGVAQLKFYPADPVQAKEPVITDAPEPA